jgi:ABC-type multidrug transport system fused ATPase/permease subunit
MHQRRAAFLLVQWAIPAIRVASFTKEDEEHRRFMALSQKSLKAELHFYLLQNFYSGTVSVVIAIGTAVVIWVGARHVLAGTLTIGALIVFTAYLTSLYGAIDSICRHCGFEGQSESARVFEIMEVKETEGLQSFSERRSQRGGGLARSFFQYIPGRWS